MEIGSILQRSWDIAWRYKSLWIFGLFIESIGSLNGLVSKDDYESIRNLINSPAFLTILLISLAIGFIFFVMHFISSAAHIDAVNKLTRGGVYSFGGSFSAGVDNFFRFLGLWFLMVGAVITLVIILAIPGTLLFLVHWALGILGLLILIPLLIAGIVSLVLLYWLAQRAVVVRGSRIADSLDEAYFLFRTYLGTCIKFALILFVIAIAISLVIIVILAIVAAPFIAMAIATEGGLWPALLIGIPVGLVLLLVLDGFYGSFFHSAVTLFYFRLLDIPLDQPLPVAPEPNMP